MRGIPDDGGAVTLTWEQYARQVRAIAAGLARLGVGRGHTVALMFGDAKPEDPWSGAGWHPHAGSRERAYLGRCRHRSRHYLARIPQHLRGHSADQRGDPNG